MIKGRPFVHSITLNANEPAIYLDTQKVLTDVSGDAHYYTRSAADARYLTLTSGDTRYLKQSSLRFAMGAGSTATSDYSFVFGDYGTATGRGAIAMGTTGFSNGEDPDAWGPMALAQWPLVTQIGPWVRARRR
jgi:hypothetical protein